MTNQAPAHRSHSQITSLAKCAYGYKLQRLDGVREQPGVAGVAGSAIHLATEYVEQELERHGSDDVPALLEMATRIAVTAFRDETREHVDRGFPVDAWKVYGSQNWSWFDSRGIGYSIDTFITWRLENPNLVVAQVLSPATGEMVRAVELPAKFALKDGTTVECYIDRIYEDTEAGNAPLIVDLKSGAKPKSVVQLGTYRLAALKEYGYPVTYGRYLYGMKHGVPKMSNLVDLSFMDEDWLVAMYGAADKQIKAGIYPPNPGDACFTCHVTHACPFYRASHV